MINKTTLRQMVWIEENNISSGIDGFACGEPWELMHGYK
ncbi:hypothetical protein Q783_06610 [Carnobacterium inhibens subsp. gilichinskyi]|uniref:Uncharacterized protein n=1 Tax=Carnobacterium inhibens subsp. gilichinskyi TaxID=1266845 RepID=U5SCP3_9LACT|nr:hypothetical protein Q783_06610 [Carnobacterium inhibens subsp. gilichinskyi]